jgi:hypothetical protein
VFQFALTLDNPIEQVTLIAEFSYYMGNQLKASLMHAATSSTNGRVLSIKLEI